jgi:hypothetical protein
VVAVNRKEAIQRQAAGKDDAQKAARDADYERAQRDAEKLFGSSKSIARGSWES